MNKKQIISIIFGIIISFLGALWSLQGFNLVHIKPILCFVDCQPITGISLQWQIAGIVTFVVGVLIVLVNIKKKL
ncbi:MAG: hypothetical protein WC582_05435 [Patescibacteria group bacterium]